MADTNRLVCRHKLVQNYIDAAVDQLILKVQAGRIPDEKVCRRCDCQEQK